MSDGGRVRGFYPGGSLNRRRLPINCGLVGCIRHGTKKGAEIIKGIKEEEGVKKYLMIIKKY